MAEQVLVVTRNDLFPAATSVPAGLVVGTQQAYLERIAREGRFIQRDAAEGDPALKQIIPYGVLTCGPLVFLMRRTRGGGEPRLHDRYTVGIGGHINPVDGSVNPAAPGELRAGKLAAGLPGRLESEGQRGAAVVMAAFERELDEELHVETRYQVHGVGILNDESNAVGQVHFGIVYRVRLAEPKVCIREHHELEGRFVEGRDLWRHGDRMETWSRILVEHLWLADLLRPGP
jgi:predicted NUDIX family phosphoesterase